MTSKQRAGLGVAQTDISTNAHIQGNNSPSAYEGNIKAAPAAGGDTNDSGSREDKDEHKIAPGTSYEDFILFPDGRSVVDVDKFQLFADLDASTKPHTGSFNSNTSSDSGVDLHDSTPAPQASEPVEGTLFAYALDEAILESVNQAVFEAIEDYDTRSRLEYVAPAWTSGKVSAPLEFWAATYHRYEAISYNLERPPRTLRIETAAGHLGIFQ